MKLDKKWFRTFLVSRRRKRLRGNISRALDLILAERHGFINNSEFHSELNNCLTALEDTICTINLKIEEDK